MRCEKLNTCLFFSEFKDGVGRRQYHLFIRSYCLGALKDNCKRLAFERDHADPACRGRRHRECSVECRDRKLPANLDIYLKHGTITG